MIRQLKAYVTVFLFREGRVLLLERSSQKERFPGQWTGIGGAAGPGELDNLEAAARREVSEETGVLPRSIGPLVLRAIDTRLEGIDVAVVFFYQGNLESAVLDEGRVDEGVLHWMEPGCLHDVPMIPNARKALDSILADPASDVILL